LAKEKGFFAEQGIDVDITVVTGVAERNSALKAGRIDGLAAPVDYFSLSAGNGIPAQIVMATDESVGGDGIVAKPPIRSIRDLAGKTVAFQRGLPSEFFLRALLQSNNVDFSTIKPVDMETAAAGAAFLAGKVDAAVVWEPWLSRAKEAKGGFVLASTKQYPNLILDTVAFRPEVVSSRPEDVQKFVNAVLKAVEYWKAHPNEANGIMAPHFGLPADKYAQILSGARFSDLARNREFFGTASKPGQVFRVGQQASEIWQSAKVIAQPVKPEAIITTKFIEGAK
jgi:NitT/TauT family transport system substrate-binding protein